jgi:hypothetical protein
MVTPGSIVKAAIKAIVARMNVRLIDSTQQVAHLWTDRNSNAVRCLRIQHRLLKHSSFGGRGDLHGEASACHAGAFGVGRLDGL